MVNRKTLGYRPKLSRNDSSFVGFPRDHSGQIPAFLHDFSPYIRKARSEQASDQQFQWWAIVVSNH